jgi:hypothetical protein
VCVCVCACVLVLVNYVLVKDGLDWLVWIGCEVTLLKERETEAPGVITERGSWHVKHGTGLASTVLHGAGEAPVAPIPGELLDGH